MRMFMPSMIGTSCFISKRSLTGPMHFVSQRTFPSSPNTCKSRHSAMPQRARVRHALGGEVMPEGGDQGRGSKESGSRASEKPSSRAYIPPEHSSSFLRHLEEVRASWPDQNAGEDAEAEGVACSGEPSIDPSRQIQASCEGDDANWM